MRNTLLGIVFVYVLIKKGLSKNIHKYSGNLLYLMLCNCLYYCFFYKYRLWDFKSNYMNIKWIRSIHIFIITPILNLMFLSNFPKNLSHRITYTVKWVLFSVFVEVFLKKCGLLFFAHGWHIGWSTYLYFKMYLYTYLFTKRPILIMSLSALNVLFFLRKFHVSLYRFNVKSFLIKPD